VRCYIFLDLWLPGRPLVTPPLLDLRRLPSPAQFEDLRAANRVDQKLARRWSEMFTLTVVRVVIGTIGQQARRCSNGVRRLTRQINSLGCCRRSGDRPETNANTCDQIQILSPSPSVAVLRRAFDSVVEACTPSSRAPILADDEEPS